MKLLDLDDPVERMVARKVIEKAEDLRVERDRVFFKNMEASVLNGVARAFKK